MYPVPSETFNGWVFPISLLLILYLLSRVISHRRAWVTLPDYIFVFTLWFLVNIQCHYSWFSNVQFLKTVILFRWDSVIMYQCVWNYYTVVECALCITLYYWYLYSSLLYRYVWLDKMDHWAFPLISRLDKVVRNN